MTARKAIVLLINSNHRAYSALRDSHPAAANCAKRDAAAWERFMKRHERELDNLEKMETYHARR